MVPNSHRSSATPVRKNRPALNNGVNMAYGSRGVADLGGQMTTGRAEETLTHFQRPNTRSQSILRQSQSVQPPPVQPLSARAVSQSHSPSPRPETGIDLLAGYEASRLLQQQAVPVRAASAASSRRSPPRAAPAAEPVAAEAAPPGAFAVFMHTLPRYLPQVLQDAEQSALQLFCSLAVIALLLVGLFATILALTALTPLPAGIALRRDHFYDGMKAAVGGTGLVAGLETPGNFSASPEWEKFLAENNEKIDARLRDIPELQVSNFKKFFLAEAQRMVEEGNSATLQKANSILESPHFKIGSNQLSAYGLIQVLYERHRVMTEVNFFSPGLGAIVHPHYTSKSASPNRGKSWKIWYYMWTEKTSAPIRSAVTALLGWEEATQCWCAENGKGNMGKAQLTVKLAHTIVPNNVIIEHIPARGTIDISSAPKTFVVWAKLNSTAEAQRVRAVQQADAYHIREGHEAICGEAPRGEKDWVCITSGNYNIHASKHVQDFYIAYPENAMIETQTIAVRVIENWGAEDHTCLYRVRVTGDLVDEQEMAARRQ